MVNKCSYCGEELEYLPFKCRYCGKNFCKKHRLLENHECTMEFKNDPYRVKEIKTQIAPMISNDYSISSSYNDTDADYNGRRAGSGIFGSLGSNSSIRFKATKSLIIINIIFFIVNAILRSNDTNLSSYLLLSATDYISPPYLFYTIISAMFVPDDIFSLILNIIILYTTGKMIEGKFGSKLLIEVYFISGLITGIMLLIFQILFGLIPVYSSLLDPSFIGYSTEMGAIMGVISFMLILMLMLIPQGEITLFPPFKLKTKMIIWLFIGFYAIFGIFNQIYYTYIILTSAETMITPDFILFYASIFGALGGYLKIKSLFEMPQKGMMGV